MKDSKANSFPDLVSYLMTSKCLANCDICISGDNSTDLNTKMSKEVISRIAKPGVKIISFAGREPFLREDIFELIKHAKSLGKYVNIENTGVLLNELCFKKLSSLKTDNLSISIDSLSKELCEDMGRPFLSKSHLEYIINSCNKYKIGLKFNSVVSKITKEEINKIGLFLRDNSPRIWKLRQFTPRSYGYNAREKYNIPEEEFLEIVNKTKRNFPEIKIEGKTTLQQSGTCFMIFPDGRIAKPEGNGHLFYGSIFDIDIKDVWDKYFINEKKEMHNKNFKNTY